MNASPILDIDDKKASEEEILQEGQREVMCIICGGAPGYRIQLEIVVKDAAV